MRIKAVSIQPGQPPVIVEIDNTVIGNYYALTDGGYIEAVMNHDLGVTYYCNEDGVMKGLAPNDLATDLFREVPVSIGGNGRVLGGVVVVGKPDREGDDTDVTAAFLARVGLGQG